MVYLNDNTKNEDPSQKIASFTFEGEILGYFTDARRTIGEDFKSYVNTTFSKSGASYAGKRTKSVTQGGRAIEDSQGDEITISNGNKTLTMKATNGQPGDFVRVITRTPETNTAPVARDVTTAVNENAISSAGDVVASSDDADGDAHIFQNSIQML